MTRAEVADYLLMVLRWEGVQANKGILVDTVERWRDVESLSLRPFSFRQPQRDIL